jgi:hypothetical protein
MVREGGLRPGLQVVEQPASHLLRHWLSDPPRRSDFTINKTVLNATSTSEGNGLKLKIKFAQALIDIAGKKRCGYHPVFDGVVLSARSAPKLLAAIKEREERAQSPAAQARKDKARQAKVLKEAARQERCTNLGIDAEGQTARWLEQGEIDDDLAELIGWKVAHRHEYTDYDQRFSDEEFYELRSIGYSPAEAREEMQGLARTLQQEEPIPATWPDYLAMYGFASHIATALAGVLKDPSRCHPVWFKEAEIAVRRGDLPLDGLTYEGIQQAIDQWRCERGGA